MSNQKSERERAADACDSTPQVSVVVPYYGCLDDVAACVRALFAQKTGRAYEIIVVDDGSPPGDNVDRLADTAEIIAIRQENMGPAAARNTGAAQARGKYILFTDADCRPDPGWMEAMCLELDAGAAGVKGIYRTEQDSWVARLVQVEYEEKYAYMSRFDAIDFIDTYSAGFRRDVFLAYGGYNERFRHPSVEDQEFSFRLSEGAELMRFCPEAVVAHRHVESVRGYFQKKMRIAFYKALILRILPQRTKGDTHTPPSLMYQLPLAAAALAGILGGLFWTPKLFLALAVILPIFLLTCRRTMRQAAQSAPDLRARVPLLMLVRAAALAAGLALGLLRFYLGPMPQKPR